MSSLYVAYSWSNGTTSGSGAAEVSRAAPTCWAEARDIAKDLEMRDPQLGKVVILSWQTMGRLEPTAPVADRFTPPERAFWDAAVDFMNRRVKVEDTLLAVAAGKRGPIEAEEAKALAVRLGVPGTQPSAAEILAKGGAVASIEIATDLALGKAMVMIDPLQAHVRAEPSVEERGLSA